MTNKGPGRTGTGTKIAPVKENPLPDESTSTSLSMTEKIIIGWTGNSLFSDFRYIYDTGNKNRNKSIRAIAKEDGSD